MNFYMVNLKNGRVRPSWEYFELKEIAARYITNENIVSIMLQHGYTLTGIAKTIRIIYPYTHLLPYKVSGEILKSRWKKE